MSTPERFPRISDFIGDAEPYDVIDNQLVPWKINPVWTQLYLVNGFPEVVVRKSAISEYENELRGVHASADEFNSLNRHGIRTVPHVVVDNMDDAYFITHKVHGVELTEALTPEAPSRLHAMVDEHWAHIAHYTRTSVLEERPYAPDILTPNQYMLGRTAREAEETVQLVDIGLPLDTYASEPASFTYESNAYTLACAVVQMEGLLGGRLLTAARLAVLAATHATAPIQAHPDASYRRSYARAAAFVLRSGKDISDLEEAEIGARFGDES